MRLQVTQAHVARSVWDDFLFMVVVLVRPIWPVVVVIGSVPLICFCLFRGDGEVCWYLIVCSILILGCSLLVSGGFGAIEALIVSLVS